MIPVEFLTALTKNFETFHTVMRGQVHQTCTVKVMDNLHFGSCCASIISSIFYCQFFMFLLNKSNDFQVKNNFMANDLT